jgi:hypothetical protein
MYNKNMDTAYTKNVKKLRILTVIGLLTGAIGISLLWIIGVAFPVYPPPGIIILLAGALFVWFVPKRWSPAIGMLLALFIIVGTLISPAGVSNLLGDAGMNVAIGQGIQFLGVLIALVASMLALRAAYRKV